MFRKRSYANIDGENGRKRKYIKFSPSTQPDMSFVFDLLLSLNMVTDLKEILKWSLVSKDIKYIIDEYINNPRNLMKRLSLNVTDKDFNNIQHIMCKQLGNNNINKIYHLYELVETIIISHITDNIEIDSVKLPIILKKSYKYLINMCFYSHNKIYITGKSEDMMYMNFQEYDYLGVLPENISIKCSDKVINLLNALYFSHVTFTKCLINIPGAWGKRLTICNSHIEKLYIMTPQINIMNCSHNDNDSQYLMVATPMMTDCNVDVENCDSMFITVINNTSNLLTITLQNVFGVTIIAKGKGKVKINAYNSNRICARFQRGVSVDMFIEGCKHTDIYDDDECDNTPIDWNPPIASLKIKGCKYTQVYIPLQDIKEIPLKNDN